MEKLDQCKALLRWLISFIGNVWSYQNSQFVWQSALLTDRLGSLWSSGVRGATSPDLRLRGRLLTAAGTDSEWVYKHCHEWLRMKMARWLDVHWTYFIYSYKVGLTRHARRFVTQNHRLISFNQSNQQTIPQSIHSIEKRECHSLFFQWKTDAIAASTQTCLGAAISVFEQRVPSSPSSHLNHTRSCQ